MAINYRVPYKCYVCGYVEYHIISVSGDYDGPDEPRAMQTCPKCEVLRETVPNLFARLIEQANLVKHQKELIINMASRISLANYVFENKIRPSAELIKRYQNLSGQTNWTQKKTHKQ